MTRTLIEQYEQSERFFWSHISKETAQIDGIELFVSGVQNPYLNCAIQRKPFNEESFKSILDNVTAFYESHDVPWVWIVREDLIDPSLITNSMIQLVDKSTIMFFSLEQTPLPTSQPSLQITENNHDLDDWGSCLGQAYGNTLNNPSQYSEAINQYIKAHKKETWGKTKFHHFVAYVKENPVSCLTLTLQNATARLDDIGTIPSQQNKGHATALIIYVLNYAKHLGADICVLESSQGGLNLYQKIGFTPIYSNSYFMIPRK